MSALVNELRNSSSCRKKHSSFYLSTTTYLLNTLTRDAAYKVNVPGFPYTTNLHSYWDGGATQWTSNPVRPLNSTGA